MPGNYKVNSYRRSLTMRTASRYTNAETDEAVILLIPSTLYLQEFPIHQIYGCRKNVSKDKGISNTSQQ